MDTQEQFLARQLHTLEADILRFDRMIDGLRELTMREKNCSDVAAELFLQDDRTWKHIRRQQAAARRAWLNFHRVLEKYRKAYPAPESDGVASAAKTGRPTAAASAPPPAPAPAAGHRRPQPEPTPVL